MSPVLQVLTMFQTKKCCLHALVSYLTFKIHTSFQTWTGLLIFRGKKHKISRDFQGQIHGKIGRFREIFAGKKSKFAHKSADFAGEKSKFAENRPISRDFSGKKSNFEGFSGQILKKIGRFHGKFWGETSPRNNQ